MRPNGNGGRHCCQPPLRRAKDMPVFVRPGPRSPKGLVPRFSILAHQLRRRFRSGIPLFREARLTYPTTWPESSLVVQSAGPGKDRNPNQNHPIFHGPSWEIPVVSRFAHRNSEESQEPRRTSERFLFRRLIPAGPNQNPRVLLNSCRRRSDLWSPAASSSPLPVSWRGRNRRPDHKSTMHFGSESRKRNFW